MLQKIKKKKSYDPNTHCYFKQTFLALTFCSNDALQLRISGQKSGEVAVPLVTSQRASSCSILIHGMPGRRLRSEHTGVLSSTL